MQKASIFLSFRGASGVDTNNVDRAQILWEQMNSILGKDIAFVANNNSGSKSRIIDALTK